MLRRVDLPEPDDPMMATSSPADTCMSTPFNTCSDWLPVV